jgi:hypothetical protein
MNTSTLNKSYNSFEYETQGELQKYEQKKQDEIDDILVENEIVHLSNEINNISLNIDKFLENENKQTLTSPVYENEHDTSISSLKSILKQGIEKENEGLSILRSSLDTKRMKSPKITTSSSVNLKPIVGRPSTPTSAKSTDLPPPVKRIYTKRRPAAEIAAEKQEKELRRLARLARAEEKVVEDERIRVKKQNVKIKKNEAQIKRSENILNLLPPQQPPQFQMDDSFEKRLKILEQEKQEYFLGKKKQILEQKKQELFGNKK